jgi:hypothetical protein
VDAIEDSEESGLGTKVVKILRDASRRSPGIKPDHAAGTRVAGTFEPIERLGNMTYPRVKGADIKRKAMPTIPPAKALVQVFCMQAG